MKYFYDCEFIEDGLSIELISIGIVREDGFEYYAVSTEFNPTRAGSWVKNNVLNQLPNISSKEWKDRKTIRCDLEHIFSEDDSSIELWAWIGAYDHVVLCQLWGSMPKLPSIIPRFTHELKQLWETAGKINLPSNNKPHNALEDARHNLAKYEAIQEFISKNSLSF